MKNSTQTTKAAAASPGDPTELIAEIDALLSRRVLIFGSLPPAGRDLDLLARPPEEQALALHLERCGFARRGRGWARFRNRTAEVVELVPTAAWDLPHAELETVFAEATPVAGAEKLVRPAPHHSLLILARRLARERRPLQAKHRTLIEAALLEDAAAWSRARKAADAWSARRALARLERRFAGRRSSLLDTVALDAAAAGRRLRRRRGLLISLSGLDGCGKSSQSEYLRDALDRAGLDPVVVWTSVAAQPEAVANVKRLANRLLGSIASVRRLPAAARSRLPAEPAPDRANALRQRSASVRFAWAMLQGLTNAVRQRRETKRHLRRGRTVICDRYVLDAVVHLRYAYGESRGRRLQELLLRRIPPRPDLSYFLDVPPEVACTRKPEYDLAQNEARAELYREICSRYGAVAIDGELPAEEINARIAAEIWGLAGTSRDRLRRGRSTPRPATRERGALIVEDGMSRHTVAAARGLHQAGWTVGVASPRRGFSVASRAVKRWHRITGAEDDLDRFVLDLRRAIREGGYEVVFGARDADALALSEARSDIPAVVPYPPHAAVVKAFDKLTLTAAAERAGIETPIPMLDLPPQRSASGRVIVKARLHPTLARKGGAARIDAKPVATTAQRDRRVAEIAAAGGEALVQEHLDGKLMALTLLVDRSGGLVARAQQEAERIYPADAGVSVRATTVPIDEELAGRAEKMLADLRWRGLAQLQFIVPDDGRPRLVDFNGRFYGSLGLAIGAGANLPAMWARLATGGDVAPVDAAPGVHYQWLWGDLRRALGERRGGLARDLAETLRFARTATHSTLSWRDPAPAAWYVVARLWGKVAKARPSFGRRGAQPEDA